MMNIKTNVCIPIGVTCFVDILTGVVRSDFTFSVECTLVIFIDVSVVAATGVVCLLVIFMVVSPVVGTGEVTPSDEIIPVVCLISLAVVVAFVLTAGVVFSLDIPTVDFADDTSIVLFTDDSPYVVVVLPTDDVTGDSTLTLVLVEATDGVETIDGITLVVVPIKINNIL